MREHLCSNQEGQLHFPTACTLPLILMTSLSTLPQLLAILENLVEDSDLTDEERLWVYDGFALRTDKDATRKEVEAPSMNAFTFLMRKNPRPTITTALHSLPVKKARVCRSGKNEKATALLINNLREASRLRHGGQERAANALVALSFPEKITETKHFQRLCTDTGKAAAKELFIGDGHRASGNILAFIRRPEMREALKHLSLSELVQPRTKRLQAIELMIKSFIHFVSVCLTTRGQRKPERIERRTCIVD
jgi:hypothetical protein